MDKKKDILVYITLKSAHFQIRVVKIQLFIQLTGGNNKRIFNSARKKLFCHDVVFYSFVVGQSVNLKTTLCRSQPPYYALHRAEY